MPKTKKTKLKIENTNDKIKNLKTDFNEKIDKVEKKVCGEIDEVDNKVICTQKRINTIDKKIEQIQKSTKTLLKIFNKPHNWLRAKSKWYYNWSLNPHSDAIHWTTMVVAFLAMLFLVGYQFGFFGGIKPSSQAAAGIPKMINYQGKITDTNNIPVPDGSYNLTIKIYDSLSGGTCLWAWKGTCGSPVSVPVSVTNGIFSVMLGDTGYQSTMPLNLDFNDDAYYLGVAIGANPEMTPRKRIGAVGYAYNSDTVDGKHESDFILKDGRAGGQTLTGGTNANDKLTIIANSAASGNTPTNTALEVKVGDSGGTTALTVLNNGNVGISAVNPTTLLQLGTPGTTSGTLSLAGSISGLVQLQSAATTANYILTLPTSAGSSGQVLSTNGSGVLSWITPGSGSGYWTLNGTSIYNNNSGYVGINISTPESYFHVNGSTTNTASRGAYSNLKINNTSASQVNITSDSLVLWNSASSWSREWRTVNETVNIASSGVNGLDTGSEAASTWYYLWIIGKPDGTVDGLISASSTSPTMPSGYTYKIRVGSIYNDASSNIRDFYSANGYFQWKTPVLALSAGNATTPTILPSPPFNTTVPSTATIVKIMTYGISNNNTYREMYINSNSNTNGQGSMMWGEGNGTEYWNEQGEIVMESPQTIYYYCNNILASLTLYTVGYTDLPVAP